MVKGQKIIDTYTLSIVDVFIASDSLIPIIHSTNKNNHDNIAKRKRSAWYVHRHMHGNDDFTIWFGQNGRKSPSFPSLILRKEEEKQLMGNIHK